MPDPPLALLRDPPRQLFFIGKDGVGEASPARATATAVP